MHKILVIDDDPGVRDTLRAALSQDGDLVSTEATGLGGLRQARGGDFDLFIVDIGLPDLPGTELVTRLREGGDTRPVVFLTARTSEEDVVRGLGLGADLYVPKPFSVPELKARIAALMRLVGEARGRRISFGDMEIDRFTRNMTRNGKSIRLTDLEFRIMVSLMEAQGRPVAREALLEKVWGIHFDPGTVTVDVHLSHLRKKLQAHGPPVIQSVKGFGWKLRGLT